MPPEQVVMRTLWMVIHRDLQHSARVRACAEFIAQALAQIEPLVSGLGVERGEARRSPRARSRARKR
jgi:hypothetical protein